MGPEEVQLFAQGHIHGWFMRDVEFKVTSSTLIFFQDTLILVLAQIHLTTVEVKTS